MNKGHQFFIVKKAVYLHGFYGPFASEGAADKAFEERLEHDRKHPRTDGHSNDFDGYHDYQLVRLFDVFNPDYNNGFEVIKTYDFVTIPYSPFVRKN